MQFKRLPHAALIMFKIGFERGFGEIDALVFDGAKVFRGKHLVVEQARFVGRSTLSVERNKLYAPRVTRNALSATGAGCVCQRTVGRNAWRVTRYQSRPTR